MARKRKTKKAAGKKSENLPTKERMARGRITIRSNIAQADEPLRIDKLLRNGVIDEMQHLSGLQIITLWTIARRPFLKAMQYERISGLQFDPDFLNVSRMSAEDQFYKTMGFLKPREHGLIGKVCFEELGAVEAGRSLGIPINSITVYLRAAFDALGDALAAMRSLRRDLEKTKENEAQEA